MSEKGSFGSDWGNQIPEFGVYGKTIHTFIYPSNRRKRYIHIYYSASKAAGERRRLEEKIHQMKDFLDRCRNEDREFNKTMQNYFYLHYDKKSGSFVYAEPNLEVIRTELDLCGYFAIISSEEMKYDKTLNLYKSRDVSEKVFRADKSYLGNSCLRVASEDAASNKIFIGFIALILRCRMYTALKNKAKQMVRKPNYLMVPAAIREVEKIEMTRQLDNVYRLDHALTKTQKEILSTFQIETGWVKHEVNEISETLKGNK